jgi:hypothetical protein
MDNTNYEAVAETIIATLAFMKERRDKADRWDDPGNRVELNEDGRPVLGSGQIMACEGLLSFLLPLSRFRTRPELQRRIYDIYPRGRLTADVYRLLADLMEIRRFSGTPYVLLRDTDGNEHPLLDTVCYAVSIVPLAEAVFGPPTEGWQREAACRVMDYGLEFLEGALVRTTLAKGWSLTNHDVPTRPFKYATWMAADTLSDLMAIDGLANKPYMTPVGLERTTRLRVAMSEVKVELARIHVDGKHSEAEIAAFGGRNVMITTGQPVREDEYDEGYAFGLWIALALLYLGYENPTILSGCLATLFRHMEKELVRSKQTKADVEIQFETEKAFKPGTKVKGGNVNLLADRSFLPQFVKALALMAHRHPDADPAMGDRMEIALKWMLDNREPGCPAWDLYAEGGGGYAVYQTERAIEALCRILEVYDTASDSAEWQRSSSVPDCRDPDWLERLPLAIADVVARHAVTIQVGAKGAEDLIARQVEVQVAAAEERLKHLLAAQFLAPLQTMSGCLDTLADAVAAAPLPADTRSQMEKGMEEFRRMNEALLAVSKTL